MGQYVAMTAALTVYAAGFIVVWFTMVRGILRAAKRELDAGKAESDVVWATILSQWFPLAVATIWPAILPLIVFISIAKLKAVWRAIRETDGA